VSVLSVRALAGRIREVRDEADVVIASYHGGVELETLPTPFIIRGLRELVDAGADVVLGHHPHVLQPAERYHGGVIIYSLGNFVFDNRRYGDRAELAAATTVFDVRLTLEDGGVAAVDYAYLPARIDADFRPRPLSGEEAGRFLERMVELERGLETIDSHAVDRRRLENMTRELHQKSFKTIVRYGIRHLRDFTPREIVVGAALAVRSLFRRGSAK
jgi:poly-gamma-glutamate synthesis protein (capsule biosynthesis protein)